MPGMCHLVISGAPYSSHNVLALTTYFTFLTSSLKLQTGAASYNVKILLDARPLFIRFVSVKDNQKEFD